MSRLRKPCLDCGRVTDGSSRCAPCFEKVRAVVEKARGNRPNRAHYAGDYRKRAALVRATATECWICHEGPRIDDPWQADHVIPGDPDSILAAAHRSCNITRSNRIIAERKRTSG